MELEPAQREAAAAPERAPRRVVRVPPPLTPSALTKSNRRSLNTPGVRTNAPTGMDADPSTASVGREASASKNVSRRFTNAPPSARENGFARPRSTLVTFARTAGKSNLRRMKASGGDRSNGFEGVFFVVVASSSSVPPNANVTASSANRVAPAGRSTRLDAAADARVDAGNVLRRSANDSGAARSNRLATAFARVPDRS